MNIDEKAMHDLIRAFTRNTKGDLEHNSSENDFVTNNGEASYSWNYIFGEIAKAATNNNLKYIVVERTKIWQFVAVLSQDRKELLLFFKEKNLRNILSKFEGRPFHYLNCLLVKNNSLNGKEIYHQLNLFSDSEIDEKRTSEAKKMLQEDFEKIDTVFVCSKAEISGNVVSVTMNLLNGFGETISQEDMTDYMLLDYETTSAIDNSSSKTPTIPKLKDKYKKPEEKTIPNEKERTKKDMKE
ncbi:hypothetical protein K5E_04680 [Enterococcus thailandicus]|uniref:DUF5986 family protein n=1 Tax=Enterococcus thailandicus TaxID=417368 RepID=UPI00244D920E|nr:DUF5986 family protein [Enterococcus thailandicus]GMC03851.1 hypothetical protein K4E_13800 [Enterococcus thailandicus]GMC08330.1 hypothetical protein K5E_04680 [Enterococcus thailandicus]